MLEPLTDLPIEVPVEDGLPSPQQARPARQEGTPAQPSEMDELIDPEILLSPDYLNVPPGEPVAAASQTPVSHESSSPDLLDPLELLSAELLTAVDASGLEPVVAAAPAVTSVAPAPELTLIPEEPVAAAQKSGPAVAAPGVPAAPVLIEKASVQNIRAASSSGSQRAASARPTPKAPTSSKQEKSATVSNISPAPRAQSPTSVTTTPHMARVAPTPPIVAAPPVAPAPTVPVASASTAIPVVAARPTVADSLVPAVLAPATAAAPAAVAAAAAAPAAATTTPGAAATSQVSAASAAAVVPPAMDRDFIARNQIVERYLSGRLPLKGATDFERFCRDNPEVLDDLGLPERVNAGLRLLEASGKPEPWQEVSRPIWLKPQVVLILAAAAALLGIALTVVATQSSVKSQKIAKLENTVREQPLDAATATRVIRVMPNREGATNTPAVTIGAGPAELVDFKIDESRSEYKVYTVTIDRVDQGRVGVIHNLTKDSNGHLRLGLNSSALGPGIYQFTIEGMSWRGDPEPDSWLTIGIQR